MASMRTVVGSVCGALAALGAACASGGVAGPAVQVPVATVVVGPAIVDASLAVEKLADAAAPTRLERDSGIATREECERACGESLVCLQVAHLPKGSQPQVDFGSSSPFDLDAGGAPADASSTFSCVAPPAQCPAGTAAATTSVMITYGHLRTRLTCTIYDLSP
jgi:hypothetical protein